MQKYVTANLSLKFGESPVRGLRVHSCVRVCVRARAGREGVRRLEGLARGFGGVRSRVLQETWPLLQDCRAVPVPICLSAMPFEATVA